jgi:hypothetical protein
MNVLSIPSLRDGRFKKRHSYKNLERRTTSIEVDRVALYWSETTIQSLRIVAKKDREPTPPQRRENRAEILNGGCLLYRLTILDRPKASE